MELVGKESSHQVLKSAKQDWNGGNTAAAGASAHHTCLGKQHVSQSSCSGKGKNIPAQHFWKLSKSLHTDREAQHKKLCVYLRELDS